MLTAQIKLLPDEQQAKALLETIRAVNEVKTHISSEAKANKVFKAFDLHKLLYHPLKSSTNLSAQILVRAFADVSANYKTQKTNGVKPDNFTPPKYKPCSAITYDSRILSLNLTEEIASIWTVEGRQKMGYQCAERDRQWLTTKPKESKLFHDRGNFYLLIAYDFPEEECITVEGYLGVDFGIANIATTSDGKILSNDKITEVRDRRRETRRSAQSKGTKNAKRVLKRQSKKEARFVKDVTHCVAKELVQEAKDTNRAIALEDLSGIRLAPARKAHRTKLHSWPFHDLREKIQYKAAMMGVPVVIVNPAYTSQACNECGYCSKQNRQTQDKFVCKSCEHTTHADINAAKNIAIWGLINDPNESVAQADPFVCDLSSRLKPLSLA